MIYQKDQSLLWYSLKFFSVHYALDLTLLGTQKCVIEKFKDLSLSLFKLLINNYIKFSTKSHLVMLRKQKMIVKLCKNSDQKLNALARIDLYMAFKKCKTYTSYFGYCPFV